MRESTRSSSRKGTLAAMERTDGTFESPHICAPRVCHVVFNHLPSPRGSVQTKFSFSPARSPAGQLMDWERRVEGGQMRWKRLERRLVSGTKATSPGSSDLEGLSGSNGMPASSPRTERAPVSPRQSLAARRTVPQPHTADAVDSRVSSILPSVTPAVPSQAPLSHGPSGVGYLDEQGVLHYRRRHEYWSTRGDSRASGGPGARVTSSATGCGGEQALPLPLLQPQPQLQPQAQLRGYLSPPARPPSANCGICHAPHSIHACSSLESNVTLVRPASVQAVEERNSIN
jgi:hypothetical protein